MKKIAIISAMELEIKPLINILSAELLVEKIWFSKINDIEIFIMVSGIGKTNIAYAITYLHLKFNINNAINIGVAGSLSEKIKPLDILLASEVIHHDFNLKEFGYNIGQVPGCDLSFIPNLNIFNDIIHGQIVSGDKFVTSCDIEKIKKDFPMAVAVDMESASFGQVASKLNIKWDVLRVISDNVKNHVNIEQYQQNKKEASQHLCSIIVEKLSKL